MAISLKDPEAEQLARALSASTGESLTLAIKIAIKDRLQRLPQQSHGKEALVEELMAMGRRCAAAPVLDGRSSEEILGYDAHGLPS
jgi:antitoxin VapB